MTLPRLALLASLIALSACSHDRPAREVQDAEARARIDKLEKQVERLKIQTDLAAHNAAMARLESGGHHKRAEKTEKEWQKK